MLEEEEILSSKVFSEDNLNNFIAKGEGLWKETRLKLQQIFGKGSTLSERILEKAFHKLDEVEMQMPVNVGNFTDFSSSKNHAMNIGIMFRGKDNAIHPNFLHMPIAYHSRASSIKVSGSQIIRPKGQIS